MFRNEEGVTMFNDQNKVIARRLIEEGFNKGDLEVVARNLRPQRTS